MHLRLLLNVNVAMLAVLGTLLMGMGRAGVGLPLAVALAAGASVWLNDVSGRFRLSRTLVNLGVIASAVVLVSRIAGSRFALDLVELVDVFAWVQIVLFFEAKTRRTWWDLSALSLLQVLVAAMMNQGPLFAAVLVVYLFFGTSALALLLLDREQAACGGVDRPAGPGRFRWGRLGKVALSTLAVGPLSLFLRFREPAPERAAAARARRGRASCPARVFADSVESRPGAPEVGYPFWRRVADMTLASVLVATVVFCAVPRFGGVALFFPRFGRVEWDESDVRRTVGFNDSVRLGELGSIIDNPEQVLQVRFFDLRTDEPYRVEGDVYLRGAVLARYEAGRWAHERFWDRPRFRPLDPDELPDGPLVRQRITIEPMDREELFCVWPFVVLREEEDLEFDDRSERLRRAPEARRRRFEFELGTTAFVDGVQDDVVPCRRRRIDRRRLLQWPSDDLAGLAALADRWIVESGLPADDPAGRARLLERRLRESDRFEYSLEGAVRDGSLDPIEDFIINNPQGHCEYFATALALMLRSRDIPARLVVGYKCDEYGYVSQAFRVRQSHAHAWVEAFVPPEGIPPQQRARTSEADWSRGGWLRLDPTPPSAGGAGIGRVVHEMGSWMEWVRTTWRRDVLAMNPARQRALIYGPLQDAARQTFRNLADPGWWHAVRRGVGSRLADFLDALLAGRSIGARVALLAALGVLGALVAYFGYRFLVWGFGLRLGRPRRARAGAARPPVRFYRRLEALVARHGLSRSHSQTQREFAREAGARFEQLTGDPEYVHLPARVAEAFYQIRFGGRVLDGRQIAAVDAALSRLEQVGDGRAAGGRPRVERP